MADRPDVVVEALEPVLARLGLSLYDVELSGASGARTLRVLVDRPGGVDLDAITAATEAVGPVLEAPEIDRALRGSYTLEVSSPGLERRLRTPEHFRGALGAIVSIKVAGPDAPGRIRGVLVDVDDDGVTVEVDDERVACPFAAIVQARTVFEWGQETASTRSKGTRSKGGRSKGARSKGAKQRTHEQHEQHEQRVSR